MKFLPFISAEVKAMFGDKINSCTFKNCTLYHVPKPTSYVALLETALPLVPLVQIFSYISYIPG